MSKQTKTSTSIGQICDRSQKLAIENMRLHGEIEDYCNKVARKKLKDPEFTFDSLPDPIVEVAFYGGGKPIEGWAKFLKVEVTRGLIDLGLLEWQPSIREDSWK